MATVYDELVELAEEVAEQKYRAGSKEIELLRIRIPEPKAEEYEPFTDDESDGEDSPYRSSLKEFLRPDPLDEVMEWLQNYPPIYFNNDESNGIFYIVGKSRTLKRMAKDKTFQTMLNLIMKMFSVRKIKIMPMH